MDLYGKAMQKPIKINNRRESQYHRECTCVEMSTVKTGVEGLLWHAHVSEQSDNDKAAIMQIKELNDILNGQYEIIGFTLEEVENTMCDVCVD